MRHYFPERICVICIICLDAYSSTVKLVIIIKRNDYKTQYRGIAFRHQQASFSLEDALHWSAVVTFLHRPHQQVTLKSLQFA